MTSGLQNSGRRASTVDQRDKLDPFDVPARPADLTGYSSEFWSTAIEPTEHLTRADGLQCAEACRMYDLYRRAIRSCEVIPLDDVAANTAQKYFNQWQFLVKQLGLTPAGRAKFSKEVRRAPPSEQTPEGKYFGATG